MMEVTLARFIATSKIAMTVTYKPYSISITNQNPSHKVREIYSSLKLKEKKPNKLQHKEETIDAEVSKEGRGGVGRGNLDTQKPNNALK